MAGLLEQSSPELPFLLFPSEVSWQIILFSKKTLSHRLKHVGEQFGIEKYSTVTSIVERVKYEMKAYKGLKNRIQKFAEKITKSQRQTGPPHDLVVTEPYGRDRVWAVAAESPIEFPAELKGDWAKADLLVKRLRNQGLSGRGAYAEAEVELVTGP